MVVVLVASQVVVRSHNSSPKAVLFISNKDFFKNKNKIPNINSQVQLAFVWYKKRTSRKFGSQPLVFPDAIVPLLQSYS